MLDFSILCFADDFEVLAHVVFLQSLHLSIPNLLLSLASLALILGLHSNLPQLFEPFTMVVEECFSVDLQVQVKLFNPLFLPELIVKQGVRI